MRFAGKYGRLCVQIVPAVQEAYATGMARVIQEPVYAQFAPGGLLPFERDLVLKTWSFRGLYQELDEATTVQADYRIGVFDSLQAQQEYRWDDETRERVEEELGRLASFYDTVLVLPATAFPPPWPRYDDYSGTPAALVRKLRDEGYSLLEVLDYEKGNQNRPAVVKALEEGFEGEFEETEAELAEETVLG